MADIKLFNINGKVTELQSGTTDGYAIVYETDDLYYLAEYDAENESILKGNQKIIEKTGVEYTWKNIKE